MIRIQNRNVKDGMQLVRCIQKGDAEAWSEFMAQYTDWVFYIANTWTSKFSSGGLYQEKRTVPIDDDGTSYTYSEEGLDPYLWIMEPSNKKISEIRIGISSAAPKPLRVYEAESIFKGQSPEPQLIEEAASIVSRASEPITDVRASREYRKEMLRVLTIRAIMEIVSGLKGGS